MVLMKMVSDLPHPAELSRLFYSLVPLAELAEQSDVSQRILDFMRLKEETIIAVTNVLEEKKLNGSTSSETMKTYTDKSAAERVILNDVMRLIKNAYKAG